MKLKSFQWSFILVLRFLVTVYSKFHPHKTIFFSFIINCMPCHHFCQSYMSFKENETLTLAWTMALLIFSIYDLAAPYVPGLLLFSFAHVVFLCNNAEIIKIWKFMYECPTRLRLMLIVWTLSSTTVQSVMLMRFMILQASRVLFRLLIMHRWLLVVGLSSPFGMLACDVVWWSMWKLTFYVAYIILLAQQQSRSTGAYKLGSVV